jgi:hypothetical protein
MQMRRILIPAAIVGVIGIGLIAALLAQPGAAPAACGAYSATSGSPATQVGGVSVSLPAGDLRFDSATVAEADWSSGANAQVFAAANALAVNLRARGAIVTFTRCDEAAVAVHLEMPAPEPRLDAYAWDGAQWSWLAGSTDRLSVDLPDLPQAVAWVEGLPIAPVIGTAPDPQMGGLAPEYQGIITEIYAPGLSVAANGSVTGQVPAAPESGAAYGVYPVVSNVVNEQVDVDSVKAMLSDEATRTSHVDRLVSIASGANFAGIMLDYGVPPDLKEAYATLVEDLAAALHANGKQLIVALYATGLPGQPAPASLDESGYDLTRIGRAADVVQIKTVARPVLDWATTKMARHKLQPVISAASGKIEGESFTSIPFAAALAGLSAQTTTPISTTTGTSLTLRLNPSLTLDQADGSYHYASDGGESSTTHTIRTAASLATAIDALSDLRLRGLVIQDVQGPDAAPNLLQPIQAYRQQTIVIGSNELNVNWTITAADGSTVLNETRPLATVDLTWAPAREGVFTVTAAIASVSRDVARVTVGAGGATTAAGNDTETGRCYNASYVADVSVPDNTRFDKGKDFTKTWRVRNSGTCAWTADTLLAFGSGSQLGGPASVKVGALDAGKTIEVSVPLKSGDKDGSYTGLWQMRNKDGAYGDQLSVVIRVGAEVAAPPPVTPPTGGGPTQFGIHAHYYGYLDSAEGAGNIALYTSELGLGWTKIQFRWGDYDFYCGGPDLNQLDSMISAANSAGLKVMLSVVTAPPCTHPWTDDVHAPPDDPAAYAEFVGGLSDLFRGRIHAIEVWNEQNISREWVSSPQKIDAARYTQLLAVSYNAIKAQDPNILVVSGALAPTGWNDGVNAVDDFEYLRQMVAAGATKYMDCVGVHVNALRVPPSAGQGGEYDSLFNPPHHSWFFKDTVQGYQSITGKPVCLTEFGVASPETIGAVEGFEWAADNSQQEQADWVTEGMTLCRQWGCRLVILWNLDYGPATHLVNDNALYSFLDIGLGRRPVFQAVKNWCAANGCK